MKKFLFGLLSIIIILTVIFFLLNINVTTRQGINYKWRTIMIPLYLKILDFFDRHYNYTQLVKNIVKDAKTDKERVMNIFAWAYANIRKVPDGFPIIDDHVWHIIIRGYGAEDQFSDVFTTLCNYAGVNAFYSCIYTEDKSSKIILSFAKFDNRWLVFDPYRGNYFKNKNGEIADIEEIERKNTWNIESLGGKPDIDYTAYFDNLPSVKDIGLSRTNIQSPLKRLMYELKKKLK